MKKILILTSLLVLTLFLVACARQADDSAFAGQASGPKVLSKCLPQFHEAKFNWLELAESNAVACSKFPKSYTCIPNEGFKFKGKTGFYCPTSLVMKDNNMESQYWCTSSKPILTGKCAPGYVGGAQSDLLSSKKGYPITDEKIEYGYLCMVKEIEFDQLIIDTTVPCKGGGITNNKLGNSWGYCCGLKS